MWIDLPWNSIRRWHQHLRDTTIQVGALLQQIDPDQHSPVDLLSALLNDAKLRPFLGAPKQRGSYIPSEDGLYRKWMIAFWGRRCAYYLGSLILGCKLSLEAISSDELESVMETARKIWVPLKHAYTPQRKGEANVKESIRSGLGFSNYYVSSLDPHLYTALTLIRRHYQEDGFSLDGGEAVILKEIADHLIVATNGGRSISTQVSDESTVWWAIATLVKYNPSLIHISENLQGPDAVVEICTAITNFTKEDVISPDFYAAQLEVTAETYVPSRTRALIGICCLQILKFLPPSHAKKLTPVLENYIGSLLDKLRADTSINQHIFLLGKALELAGNLLCMDEAKGRSVYPGNFPPMTWVTYREQVTVPNSDGQIISKNDSASFVEARLAGRLEEFSIFVDECNGLMMFSGQDPIGKERPLDVCKLSTIPINERRIAWLVLDMTEKKDRNRPYCHVIHIFGKGLKYNPVRHNGSFRTLISRLQTPASHLVPSHIEMDGKTCCVRINKPLSICWIRPDQKKTCLLDTVAELRRHNL